MRQISRFWALSAFFIAIIFIWFLYPSSGVPILAYHRVYNDGECYSISPEEFDAQMRYLSENGYSAVSLSEMMNAWEGKGQIPAKPVVISFDDGYADNLAAALPILEKYNFKATVFVATSLVGDEDYLTWDQINELKARNTEIGSHTVSHVALAELSKPERDSEIRNSKAELEQHIGSQVEFLAYPFGSYDAALPEILQQAGYRGACTGVPGQNIIATNPYLLKRVNVPQPKYGLWEFRARLLRAHIYAKLNPLLSIK